MKGEGVEDAGGPVPPWKEPGAGAAAPGAGAASSGAAANSSSSSDSLTPIGAPFYSAGCSYARGANGQRDPNAPNAIQLTSDGVNIASYMCTAGAFACPTETMPTTSQRAAGCGG